MSEARDTTPRLLHAQETARLTGTKEDVGGYLDPRAGGVHPLDYVRGLAADVAKRGVPVYVRTPVQSLHEHSSGVIVETARGRVSAKQVVLATNAYTELFRYGTDLARAFPSLEGVAIDHRWSGKVAVTLDDFPHVGRVSARIAYAMATAGGVSC